MYAGHQRHQALYQGDSKDESNLARNEVHPRDRHCLICFNDKTKRQSFYHWLRQDDLICDTCRSSLNVLNQMRIWQGHRLHMLYEYNAFLETLLFQYKEGGDVVLRDLFLYEFRHALRRRYHDATLVLMPSSQEKNEQRGFYALAQMFQSLSLPLCSLFEKSTNHKQSTLSYAKRQDIHQVMRIRQDVEIPNTRIVLVDDVCTSGATLSAAYALLKSYGKDGDALVLSVHPLFLAQFDQ
ncbi:MAG: ComF family protein [Erysipelotrichaceae bacterium]|nr:ComF family protein [Erysipelotrichaceae bacterium]